MSNGSPNPGTKLGVYLIGLRTKRGLTQRKVAKAIGVSSSFISQLESGKKQSMSRKIAEKFSNFYGLDLDDFWLLVESSRRQGQRQRFVIRDEPPDITGWVGRRTEINQLLDILCVDPPPYHVVAITGMPGIGKTTLAAIVWDRLQDMTVLDGKPFEDRYWCTFSNRYVPDNFLSTIVEVLSDQPVRDIPYQRKISLLIQALQAKRILVVMNSLEEWIDDPGLADAANLLLSSLCSHNLGSSIVILTSRVLPDHLYQVPRKLKLEGLEIQEGLTLIRQSLPDDKKVDDELLRRLVDRVEGHPLILRILTNMLMNRDRRFLLDLLNEVSGRSLNEIAERFWAAIWGELSQDEQRVLRRISVYRHPVSIEALKLVMSLKTDDRPLENSLQSIIKSLIDRSLVNSDLSMHRYMLHQLIRPYMYKQLQPDERIHIHRAASEYYEQLPRPQPEEWEDVDELEPLLESHYHLSRAGYYQVAHRRFFEEYGLGKKLREYGSSKKVVDACLALLPAVFEEEQLVKLRIKWDYQDDEIHRKLYDLLPDTVAPKSSQLPQMSDRTEVLFYLAHTYSSDAGRPREAIPWYELILEIAPSDPESSLRALRGLGTAYSNMGESRKSIGKYEQAIAIAEQSNQFDQQALCAGYLCSEYTYVGEFSQARRRGEQALELSRQINDPLLNARNLTDLGIANLWEGKYSQNSEKIKESIKIFEKALSINQRADSRDKRNEGRTLINLGEAYTELAVQNQHSAKEYLNEASRFLSEALEVNKGVGDERRVAMCYSALGRTYLVANDFAQAIDLYNQAFAIYRENCRGLSEHAKDERILAVDAINLGMWCQSQGYENSALKWYLAAYSRWEYSKIHINSYFQNNPRLLTKWRDISQERQEKEDWIFYFRQTDVRLAPYISLYPDPSGWIDRYETLNLCKYPFKTILFFGLGGIGKSCLAARIINPILIAIEMREEEPFELVYWHGAGATLDSLLVGLERALGGPAIYPESAPVISKIISLLRHSRILLVIDALEDSLRFGGGASGSMSREMEEFLAEWCASRASSEEEHIGSRIICTSRIMPLGNFIHSGSGTAYTQLIGTNEFHRLPRDLVNQFACIPIKGMEKENGIDLLLQALPEPPEGEKYSDELLERAVSELDGHPLFVSLLGTLVGGRYSRNRGQSLNKLLGDALADETLWEEEIGKSKKLLDSIWKNLDRDEQTLLKRVSVYRYPESAEAWNWLLRPRIGEHPAVLRKTQTLIDSLVSRSLIQAKQEDHYGLHPIIQEYSYRQLKSNPDEFLALHQAACEYYTTLCPQLGAVWQTMSENLKEILESHYHASQAGNYHEAYKRLFVDYGLRDNLRKRGFSQMLIESCQLLLPAVLNKEQVAKLRDRWIKETVLTSDESSGIPTLFVREGFGDFATEIYMKFVEKWNKDIFLTQAEVDELLNLWTDEPAAKLLEPLQRAEILFYLADAYANQGRPRMAIPLYRISLEIISEQLPAELADESGKKRLIPLMEKNELGLVEKSIIKLSAKIYRGLGTAFSQFGLSIPTIYYYLASAKTAEFVDDWRTASLSYGYICLELPFIAQFDLAYSQGKKAIDCCPEEDKETMARTLCDIASARVFDAKFRQQEQIKASPLLCDQAVLCSIDVDAERSIGRSLIYLALACVNMAMIRKGVDSNFYLQIARKYAISALKESEKVFDQRRIGNTYSNIAAIYLAEDDIQRAASVYQLAFEIHEKGVGNNRTLAHDLIDLARYYDTKKETEISDRCYRIALAKRPESGFLIKTHVDEERFIRLQKEAQQTPDLGSASINLGKVLEIKALEAEDVEKLSEKLQVETGWSGIETKKFAEHKFIKEQILKDLEEKLLIDLADEQVRTDIEAFGIEKALEKYIETILRDLV